MALKRVRRSAGTAAQAMPPSVPASAIAGSTNQPSTSYSASATAAPAIAPTTSCPSAPMFHTCARNPIDSATPIMTSGAAFTPSSATA